MFVSGQQATLTGHHASGIGCKPSTFANSVIVSLGRAGVVASTTSNAASSFSALHLQQGTTVLGEASIFSRFSRLLLHVIHALLLLHCWLALVARKRRRRLSE